MLIVGTDKSLLQFPRPYLFIDDDTDADFDHAHHSFNPLRGLTPRRERELLFAINSYSPGGESTLTQRYSNAILRAALRNRPRKLSQLNYKLLDDDFLIKPEWKSDAQLKIHEVLSSPVLNRVLTNPPNFSFKGTIHARLNRIELGDEDCYFLGQLLISQYKGTVVLPDYGFYQAPHHSSLIREGRLIAGVNYLDELSPKLKHLFLLGEVIPSHCTFEDAETIALQAGKKRGLNEFSDEVHTAMKG